MRWKTIYTFSCMLYIHKWIIVCTQSCLTLCGPMARLLCPWNSPARILEWVAIPFSKGSSWSRDASAISMHGPPPSWGSLLPTHLGHHTAPSWAPCVIQKLPTSHLFYTWYWIYVSYSLSLSHPLLPTPTRVHESVLCVCISIAALRIGSSVPSF